MTGWRHVERFDDGRCAVDVEGLPCGCYPPTPDPTSPCGYPECPFPLMAFDNSRYWHAVAAPLPEPTSIHHPHVPTRCTCGHPIEAVP